MFGLLGAFTMQAMLFTQLPALDRDVAPEREVTFVVWFNASSLLPTDDNIAAVINAQRDRLRDIALRLR